MSQKKIKLGSCVYFPEERIILTALGGKNKLSHLPAELLKYLYQNAQRYVSIEELKETVWKNQSVEDNTITGHISNIRKALEDSSDCRYIETRRNYGYQFVAAVGNVDEASPFFFKQSIIYVAIISIVLFISYEFFYQSPVVLPQNLTTLLGQEIDGASANGFIVFSHKPEGKKHFNIYAKRLNSERYFPLTIGPFDDRRSVFSPDGNQIAFQRHNGQACQIVIATVNRTEVAITLVDQQVVFSCLSDLLSVSIAWKDKHNLFLSFPESLSSPHKIYQHNLLTKQIRAITEPPQGSQGDYYGTYSTASKKLAFFRHISNSKTEIWIKDDESNQPRKIASLPLPLLSAAWVNNGKGLVIKTGVKELCLIDVDTGSISRIALNVNYPVDYPFSINSQTIGFMRESLRVSDIQEIATDGESTDIILSSFHDYMPVIASDTKELVFISTRSGQSEIWLYSLNNGESKQLTQFAKSYSIDSLTMSRDGSVIAYIVNGQISIMDNKGNIIFTTTGFSVYKNLVFTPDAKTLYYSVNVKGEWRVESRQLNNLESPINHSEGYVILPCDGPQCFYVIRFNDPVLYRLKNGKLESTEIVLGDIQYPGQVSIDDYYIYYVAVKDTQTLLMQYDFHTKISTEMSKLPLRYFSMDQKSKSIFTYNLREHETMLETINLYSPR